MGARDIVIIWNMRHLLPDGQKLKYFKLCHCQLACCCSSQASLRIENWTTVTAVLKDRFPHMILIWYSFHRTWLGAFTLNTTVMDKLFAAITPLSISDHVSCESSLNRFNCSLFDGSWDATRIALNYPW